MKTTEPDQQGLLSYPPAQGTLPLRELFPYWGNLLWKESMRPLIQHLFEIDLTMSESQILRHLASYQRPLAVSEVADYLTITHSAASRAVDRLVNDAFISRTENPTDRRQKQLQLTDQGVQLVQMLNSIFSSGIERLVARLPAPEQEQFCLLIAHMIAASSEEARP